MYNPVTRKRASLAGLVISTAFALAGCATAPTRVATAQPALPDTRVFFYPAADRPAPSPEQQRRDQYECNAWAVGQSHFDPSNPPVMTASTPIRVAPSAPDGTGTLIGAASGALVGAAVSNPWHAGRGTLIGALTGAAIGTVADSQRRTAQEQPLAEAQPTVSVGAVAQAANYRRAMGACLEGRGYSIG